jgi:F-type H+-transporting ATPase subunit a
MEKLEHPSLLHYIFPFIPEHIIMTWFIMVLLIGLGYFLSKNTRLIPSRVQAGIEMLIQALENLLEDSIGHKGKKYLPLVGTLALYILTSNLIGLIPGFKSPTNNLNTTAACALIVFIYYNFEGIREHGVWKYFRHFMGPGFGEKGIPWLAPLLFPIEIISHIARPLSLSIRLFGNIMGEDLVLAVLAVYILPVIIPLPMMFLAVFTSVIQTFIFVLLTCLYLSGAVAEEEGH